MATPTTGQGDDHSYLSAPTSLLWFHLLGLLDSLQLNHLFLGLSMVLGAGMLSQLQPLLPQRVAYGLLCSLGITAAGYCAIQFIG